MISRISLPHTPIRRIRRNRPVSKIRQFTFERTPKRFTPSTPLPALVTAKRNGKEYMARADKTNNYHGHIFVRITFADGFRDWTNISNIVEVV